MREFGSKLVVTQRKGTHGVPFLCINTNQRWVRFCLSCVRMHVGLRQYKFDVGVQWVVFLCAFLEMRKEKQQYGKEVGGEAHGAIYDS